MTFLFRFCVTTKMKTRPVGQGSSLSKSRNEKQLGLGQVPPRKVCDRMSLCFRFELDRHSRHPRCGLEILPTAGGASPEGMFTKKLRVTAPKLGAARPEA